MREYLVEVTRGRKLIYRTPAALRAAMRSGEISPDSRIFHRTTSTWVSITEHPEYRRFLTDAHVPVPVDPATPADSAEPPDTSRTHRFFRGLAVIGGSVMRRLPMHLDSKSPTPVAPAKPPAAGRSVRSARPTPPAQQPEPERSRSAKDRSWTFLP